jgi:hypothetical protein
MRIHWAGTFICLVGKDTHKREWVNWEIEQANKKGKRIVGTYIEGAEEANVPESLNKYGDALVKWNANRIISSIEGENYWENPDGKNREPHYKPKRSEC